MAKVYYRAKVYEKLGGEEDFIGLDKYIDISRE
jgi:hypothetical protein